MCHVRRYRTQTNRRQIFTISCHSHGKLCQSRPLHNFTLKTIFVPSWKRSALPAFSFHSGSLRCDPHWPDSNDLLLLSSKYPTPKRSIRVCFAFALVEGEKQINENVSILMFIAGRRLKRKQEEEGLFDVIRENPTGIPARWCSYAKAKRKEDERCDVNLSSSWGRKWSRDGKLCQGLTWRE